MGELKVYSEKIDLKRRYFVGVENKESDGRYTFVHCSGYFKSVKEAEKRKELMESEE